MAAKPRETKREERTKKGNSEGMIKLLQMVIPSWAAALLSWGYISSKIAKLHTMTSGKEKEKDTRLINRTSNGKLYAVQPPILHVPCHYSIINRELFVERESPKTRETII
jgi:hypothetical protein